ncbi:hypothetical protein KI387_038667, partial [Taxus chinensis]
MGSRFCPGGRTSMEEARLNLEASFAGEAESVVSLLFLVLLHYCVTAFTMVIDEATSQGSR